MKISLAAVAMAVAMAAADMSADHARRDLEHGRPKR